MNDLTKKIALITGSTSGIGEACAIRFAKAGAYVIVSGRNLERGKNVVDAIRLNKGEATFLPMDQNNDKSIEDAARMIKDQFGKIDILFNNAGIFPMSQPLENIDRESINNIYDNNTSGVLMTIKHFMPLMSWGGGNFK